MGISQTKYPGLTEDVLEEYSLLTYLNKGEILYLMKRFYSINPDKIDADFSHRFKKDDIVAEFKVLKRLDNRLDEEYNNFFSALTQNNPFQDRLFRVFSSQQDGCFSFEDMLDLCSVMSSACPTDVKATWAFRVFDIDEDNQISAKDICNILDRLIWDPNNRTNYINQNEKMRIAKVILDEINLDQSGSISLSEFKLVITRIPEFSSSFYFRV